jgi:PAS domain S-box-containing protein
MKTNIAVQFIQSLFSGRKDERNDIEIKRRVILINVISIIGIMALVPLGLLALVEDNPTLGYFDLFVAAVLIAICLGLRRTGYHIFYSYFGLILVGALFVYLFAAGGAHNTGHLWYYTFPLVTSFLLGSKRGAILTGTLFAIALLLFVIQDYSPDIIRYSKYFKLRFIFSFLVVSALSYLYENAREKAQQQLIVKNADLEKSEDRYRSLVENTMEGYFICDIPSGRFLFLNERSCDIYGYTLQEGLKLTIWDVISSEDHERVQKRIQARLEGKKLSSERQAYTSVRKDGSTIRAEISTSLITFQGRPVVQGVVRDITEQESLERQLQQSKKMEAIGLLAGGVAHDLNNVLSGIVSYPSLILMDLPEDSPLRKPIQTIHRSGQKAAEIVQDLLTLARRGVSTKSVLNLNDVILDYLKSPENEKLRAHHSNVSIETDLDKNLLNIEGSSIQLIKMIMNLVSNSAEAQPTGGKIVISTHNQYVDMPIQGYEEIKEGDFVVLEIKDNGFGIATEDLNRIFEPFYTKKAMGRSGTGLGMAVVWGTIHDHDGYIDVKSTEGVGTTFSLFFPVMRANITNKEFVPVENYLGNHETILVVDDIVEQREIAATILTKLNYSVKTASSGEDAVTHLKDNSADLLILDMIMEPGIDGLETYRRIKALHPNQKAIIASGYSETDRVKEAQRLGAGKYIRKPYTLEKIGIAVKDELSK